MPTPFQHLHYAQQILLAPSLPAWLRERIEAESGAFLLGNTAGDVQTITGQRRVETHFYSLSDLPRGPACDRLLTAYPSLADPWSLSPARAAFVSGYLVHLVWDEIWADDVFIPLYRDSAIWPDWESRFIHHNALRVHLDRESYAALDRDGVAAALESETPVQWLPFVPDAALKEWRDWLAIQLRDPSSVETAAVFAERMAVPVTALENIVDAMAGGRYVDVPRLDEALVHYEAAGQVSSVRVLLRYWSSGPRLVRVPEDALAGSECRGKGNL